MQIGKYKLYTIQTGLFKLDGGVMFGIVPKPLWSTSNPADDKNRIDMCMRSLLLVSDDKKILIDNGVGYKTTPKFRDIYAIEHAEYTTEKELNKLDIRSEDITDMIFTHLHFDHSGGTTYRDENRELKLRYPYAKHYVQKRHWEWALNPSERDKASFIPDNYKLLENTGQLELFEGDIKFDENISLLTTNGHTPQQQIVHISDGDKNILFTADLIPMAAHIHLPYIMSFDLFPLTTLEEKKKFLLKAADEEWNIFLEHDPYTEICTITTNDKGFAIKEKRKLSELA